MSNYNTLKATIDANVKTNGNQAITGSIMNSVLNQMVTTLGAGYQYMGVANKDTNPGTPDAKVCYVAATPGTYTNFKNSSNVALEVADGEVVILKYDTAWSKEVTGAATAAQVTQLGQEVRDNDAGVVGILGIKNLVSSWEQGAMNSDGTDNANVNCRRSNFIPVSSTKKYKICGSTGSAYSRPVLVGYSSDDASTMVEVVKGTSGADFAKVPFDYTPGATTQFIRVSYQITFDGPYGVWDISDDASIVKKVSDLEEDVLSNTDEISILNEKIYNEPHKYDFVSVRNAGVAYSDGTLTDSSGERVTDFIPVKPGDVVFFKGAISSNVFAMIAAFTSDDEDDYSQEDSVQATGNALDVTYVVPAGINYIRLSQNKDYLTGIYYTILSPIPAYNDISELKEGVRELMNIPKRYEFESVYNGYVVYSDGSISSTSVARLSDYIPVTPGSTIFFKGLTFSSAVAVLAAYSSEKSYIQASSVQGTGNTFDLTYIVPDGVYYVRFSQSRDYLTGIYYTILDPLPIYRDVGKLKDGSTTSKDSVNLFDKDNMLEGYYYNTSSYSAAEGYAMTNPIKVSSGITYKFPHAPAMGGVRRCAKCDEQGTYIQGYNVDESGDFDTFTPTFDGYVRFNVGLVAAVETAYFMVAEASKYPSVYIPYGRTLDKTWVDETAIIQGYKNPLYGKVLACDGDSICYGVGYRNGYAGIIASRNKMQFQNLGIAGATLASDTYNGETARHWISTNVANLRSDADYIIIEGGVNDSESMGTMSPTDFVGPFDSTTFCGAIDTLCQSLLARFPGKKIGFIIVHAVNVAWMPGGTKYEAVLAGLKKWGIPVCDLIEQCPPFGLLPNDDYLKVNYTKDGDGWHPNEEGYKKYYCDKIEAWMRGL